MKKVLTIAGSDSSGGAGIQADLKTMLAHGVYGMSAITALTAQNTTGVYGVMEATGDFVALQLDCVFQDIRPDAVKIGMVGNTDVIAAIARKLGEYKAKNIVVDPVMVATSGSALMKNGAADALVRLLFPLASAVTPNLPEAECLCGFPIHSAEEMEKAAQVIGKTTPGGVIIKGGHLTESADDLLWYHGEIHWYRAPRVDNSNSHGTGCTLSSAIASNLALGLDLPTAFGAAKAYVAGALAQGLNLGAGSGPLPHGYRLKKKEEV
jgi:hydroxymethylpyrimidine/phosphomethylpyrimidine kinase